MVQIMGSVAVQAVKKMVPPLFVRAVVTGALFGAVVSVGLSVFSTIQAALYPEQFGLFGLNAGQILFMAILGLFIGAIAGLATCTGAVAALWFEATESSVVVPRTLTAGIGAGAMTVIYTVVVLHVLGATGLGLVGIGVGFATVSGLLAALHTQRLIRRSQVSSPGGDLLT